jgi:hypothetical protein
LVFPSLVHRVLTVPDANANLLHTVPERRGTEQRLDLVLYGSAYAARIASGASEPFVDVFIAPQRNAVAR